MKKIFWKAKPLGKYNEQVVCCSVSACRCYRLSKRHPLSSLWSPPFSRNVAIIQANFQRGYCTFHTTISNMICQYFHVGVKSVCSVCVNLLSDAQVQPVYRTAACRVWWCQMLCDAILTSWWWARLCSKHVEEHNKLIIKQELMH